MNAVYVAKIIAGFTGCFVILIAIMMIVLYRRRHQLIKMGHLVNGTVLDIEQRRGTRDKYYVSVIEYMHHQQGKTIVQRFSARHPRRYKKDSQVDLYYHPELPQKFVLRNDTTTKVGLIFLGIFASIVLIAGILGMQFLLNKTYVK